jgi:hypothetical protein
MPRVGFYLISIVGGGVQLGPFGTAATNGLLCQPRVIMIMEKLVEWLAGETEVLGETCPSAALSTTNPTCPDANLGRRGGKPASNRLSYGTTPRVGYEPTIPAFERAETVHSLDCAATVIGKNVRVSVNNSTKITFGCAIFYLYTRRVWLLKVYLMTKSVAHPIIRW